MKLAKNLGLNKTHKAVTTSKGRTIPITTVDFPKILNHLGCPIYWVFMEPFPSIKIFVGASQVGFQIVSTSNLSHHFLLVEVQDLRESCLRVNNPQVSKGGSSKEWFENLQRLR